MVKYRKKPIVVDAVQFDPDGAHRFILPDGVVGVLMYNGGWHWHIDTLEGRAYDVVAGDWIITGVKGERHLCKPDVFAATYEPVTT